MSFWARAMVAVMKAVSAPTTATRASTKGASSNRGDIRTTMNTPAVTMVAA